jgi:hypothetical protein
MENFARLNRGQFSRRRHSFPLAFDAVKASRKLSSAHGIASDQRMQRSNRISNTAERLQDSGESAPLMCSAVCGGRFSFPSMRGEARRLRQSNRRAS